MVETRTVLVCMQCETSWPADAERPGCPDPSHAHQQFTLHSHRDLIVMPDGTALTAVSFDPIDPYDRHDRPAFGLYLDAQWNPPWPHELLDWPDFGVPGDPTQVVAALRSLLARAQGGERVEIGCLGGHGRTGTALACLAILCGHPIDEAVDWVRREYCGHAVETEAQEAFVRALPV